MRLVAAELSLVAPNQRRTETGVGTQSPPRTNYPGPTREGFGFPRLGWSVPLSQSPNREGLPSPLLERLVATNRIRCLHFGLIPELSQLFVHIAFFYLPNDHYAMHNLSLYVISFIA